MLFFFYFKPPKNPLRTQHVFSFFLQENEILNFQEYVTNNGDEPVKPHQEHQHEGIDEPELEHIGAGGDDDEQANTVVVDVEEIDILK